MKHTSEQKVPQSGTSIKNDGLDAHRAAVLLGLAEHALRKMWGDGNRPPYLNLNRTVRYHVRDIEAWLDARLTSKTSGAKA